MIPTSVILTVTGLACVLLSGFAMYKLSPREGKPPSAWMKTESRATGVALGVFVLFIAGGVLLAKGIFA